MNVVFPFLQVLFFDHNKWTSSNSWVASCSILESKCNVNAQYKPTSSWKASCSILMLKCKRVRSPRQRRAFDIPPWNSASQNKQHNSRHFFLTNSQYFSDICRIFVEYFWNISRIFSESHNKQDNSQHSCQIFSPLSCPIEGRQIPVMICERSAKVFWLLASPPPSHWQTKTLFGQIHS